MSIGLAAGRSIEGFFYKRKLNKFPTYYVFVYNLQCKLEIKTRRIQCSFST